MIFINMFYLYYSRIGYCLLKKMNHMIFVCVLHYSDSLGFIVLFPFLYESDV